MTGKAATAPNLAPSAVRQQGDAYTCAAASPPFLFEPAGGDAAPDRAAIVKLLVSIGREAVERCEYDYDGRTDDA